jgi:hypothetical protein
MERTILALLILAGTSAAAQPFINQEPLSDRDVAEGGDWYQGTGEPGLFPGGANAPAGATLVYGRDRLAQLVPRDALGNPSPDGWIGFLSVGLSNTNQEWSRFERTSDALAEHSGRVVMVDAAVGGVHAAAMATPGTPEYNQYWSIFDSRLPTAGITAAQVQAIWLKQHLPMPYPQPTYPAAVDTLKGYLEQIVGILRARLPNLQVVYFSSRIYAGHGNNVQEPFGFESAFAVKRAIEDQINGIGGLDTGPWLTWGPYLWADGTHPRSDGLTWQPSDIESDATHPTLSGEIKVSDLLRGFFGANTNATPWYGPGVGPLPIVREATGDAFVDNVDPGTAHGLDPTLDFTTSRPVHVKFDLTGLPAVPLVRAKLSLISDDVLAVGSGSVYREPDAAWDEATLTATNDWTPPGGTTALGSWLGWSRGAAVGVDVTTAVEDALEAGDPAIAFALISNVAMNSQMLSREGGEPPRLLLVFDRGELFRDSFEVGSGAAWSATTP